MQSNKDHEKQNSKKISENINRFKLIKFFILFNNKYHFSCVVTESGRFALTDIIIIYPNKLTKMSKRTNPSFF